MAAFRSLVSVPDVTASASRSVANTADSLLGAHRAGGHKIKPRGNRSVAGTAPAGRRILRRKQISDLTRDRAEIGRQAAQRSPFQGGVFVGPSRRRVVRRVQ